MFWFQQDIAIWKIIYELHSLGVKKSTMTFTFDLVTLYQKLCLCEAWTKRESEGSIHALDKDILHYHLWLTIDQEIFLKVTACTLFDQRHSASEVRVRMDQGKKILIHATKNFSQFCCDLNLQSRNLVQGRYTSFNLRRHYVGEVCARLDWELKR